MGEIGDKPDQTVSTLRVWIDAQLPPALARSLRTEQGIDAVHVEDLRLHRARDPVIFSAARDAGTVVVLTKDDDFSKLVGQHGPPPQVIWVRCGNVSNQELCRIVHEAWARTAELLAEGEPLVEIRRRSERAS